MRTQERHHLQFAQTWLNEYQLKKPPFDYEQQCQAHPTGVQAIAPSSVVIDEETNLISGRSSRFFQSADNEIEINSSFGSYDQLEKKIDQIDELDFQEEYSRKINQNKRKFIPEIDRIYPICQI